MSKRRKKNENLPVEERFRLLRRGLASEGEIADAVADFGTSNFIEARDIVEEYLDDPSEIVRYNAMATLAYEWGVCGRPDRLIEILLHDEDVDCRRQAAGALGSLFRQKKDSSIAKHLLAVIRNDTENEGVRAFAYTALLDVMGVPRDKQPSAVGLKLNRPIVAHAETLVANNEQAT